jgi:signal peptidase II
MASSRVTRFGWKMCALALALDQLSKWYILERTDLPFFNAYTVTPFFNLVMVWNKGVSFGMFSGNDQPFILIGISLVIIVILVRWLVMARTKWISGAIGLVIGGATGNIIDRLRFGAVADFLDFHIDIYHWPAFNIADSAIFIGVVILCVDSMFGGRK